LDGVRTARGTARGPFRRRTLLSVDLGAVVPALFCLALGGYVFAVLADARAVPAAA
jgi:hypothetical protein